MAPGGEHVDGLTRNALVPLRDGAYLELVAFTEPESDRDNVWGWRGFLPHEGLIDYCAASEDLRGEAERLRGLGFEVEDLGEGGRRLPEGEEIRWRSASIRQDGRVLPFLIEDVTPRARRVPGGPAADHPNGAAGIARLEISAPDSDGARRDLAALTGVPSETLKLGACELVIANRGGGQRTGPASVVLLADAAGSAGELDRRLSHGVRFTLAPEAGR